jgi:hypothetical protein
VKEYLYASSELRLRTLKIRERLIREVCRVGHGNKVEYSGLHCIDIARVDKARELFPVVTTT